MPSSTRRPPGNPGDIWQTRTNLVKQEMAAESAATDAKTARLKALRLEKEAQDAQAAANEPQPLPAKKRTRRSS